MNSGSERTWIEWLRIGMLGDEANLYLASGDRLTAFLRWAQGDDEANADATLRQFLEASVRRDKALLRRLADMVASRVSTGFEQDPELGILLRLLRSRNSGAPRRPPRP